MKKFHEIPTDNYVPISHDNRYLFDQFDRIANFLTNNLDKNYKNILGKPVQNGFVVDWFSVTNNLTNINTQSKAESESALLKYWEFIDAINLKIKQLSKSSDPNDKNWSNILTKTFDQNDNFIFSNGTDICIIWGWRFNNNEIYKPNINIVDQINPQPIEEIPEDLTSPRIKQPDGFEPKPEVIEEVENLEDEDNQEVQDYIYVKEDPKDDSNFTKFLKWFASKFWWLLMLLLLLIICSLLFKSCNSNDPDINNKLNQLEEKANACCN